MPTPAQPEPGKPLSEERKQRIEAEELALAQAEAQRQKLAQEQRAEAEYRQQVRIALRSRFPWWRPWVLPVGLMMLLANLVWLGWQTRSAAAPEDGWGGILTSDLVSRCQAQASAQVPESLTFPSRREVAGQISADADGKSWNGWVNSGHERLEFVCRYSPALDSVTLELLP